MIVNKEREANSSNASLLDTLLTVQLRRVRLEGCTPRIKRSLMLLVLHKAKHSPECLSKKTRSKGIKQYMHISLKGKYLSTTDSSDSNLTYVLERMTLRII